MTRKKIAIRMLLGLLILWLGVVAWGFVCAWRRLPEYIPMSEITPAQPILSAKEYRLGHKHPYLVQTRDSAGDGAVLIFGAAHVRDPTDSSLETIRREFQAFAPTVVLCEGRMTGLLFPGLMDPVTTFGEPGLVRQLGYSHDCKVYTWEPPEQAIVRGLMDQSFDTQQIALRIVLSPYFSNLRFGKPDNPELYVLESIRNKRSWPQIGDVFSNVADIDQIWRQYFPDGPDWREVSDETELPGFLGEMDSNLVRDQHLFNIICELVDKGQRVFVIAGSSHAVKLENAVKASIN